ncbi:MAG TPA: PadR family transcriptional regulator [Streptosporangiaceae bacterium]|nr:PadR family transcriptional regulator [Streptosporangiaceae bacterium]
MLALLAVRPAHGYELKGSFDQAAGEQWGGLNIGHLYQLLDRLSRDGLIESERRPQQIKPDRVVHRLTSAGRDELERWLNSPTPRAHGYRDDFFLKVIASVQAGQADTLDRIITQQRTHLLKELRSLDEARTSDSLSPIDTLLVTAAELHARADLGIVEAVEESIGPDMLAALRIQSAPPLYGGPGYGCTRVW